MLSATEIWAAGGGSTGYLWHSTDGGVTWDKFTTLMADALYVSSFVVKPDKTGMYAAGVLRSQLCSILKIDF